MIVDALIKRDYPFVDFLAGVNVIEDELIEKKYFVVFDEEVGFRGILTPHDLVLRPHKLVADCLVPKDTVSADDTLSVTLDLFERNNTIALAVFKDGDFEGILEKETVIEELHREFRALSQKSVISERVKSNFLENISHEIRTPLNGITGFIELLRDYREMSTIDERERAHDIISECMDRFLFSMQNLLELSLIQSGIKSCLKEERVSIGKMFSGIERYFDTVEVRFEEKKRIIFTESEEDLSIFTDREVLTEVVYHLITMAHTVFNTESIYIGYTVYDGGDDVVLYVSDHRLLMEEQSPLFLADLFSDEREKEFVSDGMGIGLILIKEYGSLINAEIKTNRGQVIDRFYCRVPMRGDGELLEVSVSEAGMRQC